MTIYQVLPSISKHDAISQHVLCIDSELKNRGIETLIVAEHVDPRLSEVAKSSNEVDIFDGPILYHLSISSQLAERVLDSNQEIDIWYHNITPPDLFEKWEPFVALELRIALMQRSQLALRARRAVAASEFSRQDLIREGARHTCVMPVLFDPKSKIQNTNIDLDRKLTDDSGPKILSVGRIAPHKRIEKIIAAFIHFRRNFSKNAKLNLIGSSASKDYLDSLIQFVNSAGEGESITFHGMLNDDQLASYYQGSDLYICTSAHEGFCVPLVEAMAAGVPIVASRAGAIEETLSGGGLLVDAEALPFEYACAMDIVLSDQTVSENLVRASSQRINQIDLVAETKKCVDWIIGASVPC